MLLSSKYQNQVICIIIIITATGIYCVTTNDKAFKNLGKNKQIT